MREQHCGLFRNKRATAQFCLKRNKYTQKMRLSVQNVLGMGHFGAVAV